ncbi:MAG: heavy metal-binding domain-containing protein [Vulcanimicrobiaceae bacterium]
MVAPEFVVTFDSLAGYRIVRRLGQAIGQASRPRSALRANLRTMFAVLGFAPPEVVTDAERARAECLAALIGDADRLGANGIVGVRFEALEAPGVMQVRAVGQAVVVEREETPA